MHNLIALGAFLAVIVLLVVLRRALGLFWSAALFFVATLAYIRYGVEPRVPGSIVKLYGSVALLALLLYATSSEAGREQFFGPFRRIMVEPGRRPILALLLVLVVFVFGAVLSSSFESSCSTVSDDSGGFSVQCD